MGAIHVAVHDPTYPDWVILARRSHEVFLSHSGAQKDFVDQLWVDLERAKQSPFVDKRSLSKGEAFPERLLSTAQACAVAVVVVSDEYFSRSKWPMLELSAIVRAPSPPRILPVFLLSCKEMKKTKRRRRWFALWEEWAKNDPRVCLSDWKEALHELEGRTGMEYFPHMGEVAFRENIVHTICAMNMDSPKVKAPKLFQTFRWWL